jgi:hypothetical protein
VKPTIFDAAMTADPDTDHIAGIFGEIKFTF